LTKSRKFTNCQKYVRTLSSARFISLLKTLLHLPNKENTMTTEATDKKTVYRDKPNPSDNQEARHIGIGIAQIMHDLELRMKNPKARL